MRKRQGLSPLKTVACSSFGASAFVTFLEKNGDKLDIDFSPEPQFAGKGIESYYRATKITYWSQKQISAPDKKTMYTDLSNRMGLSPDPNYFHGSVSLGNGFAVGLTIGTSDVNLQINGDTSNFPASNKADICAPLAPGITSRPCGRSPALSGMVPGEQRVRLHSVAGCGFQAAPARRRASSPAFAA